MLNQVNVKFGADVSGLRTGVEQSKRMLGGLKSAAAGITGFVAAIVGSGLVAGARQIISEFARIQDLADRFGISAEQMQKLGFIAKQNGTDIESMASALQRATIAAQKAVDGNKELQKSFEALGTTGQEFLSLSMTDRLAALASGFKSAKTEGEGFAAVIAIMGKSGGGIIPTLRGGAEGVKELADSFNPLNDASVAAFARTDDAIERMSASFKNLIAGPLADLLEWFEEFKIKSDTGLAKVTVSAIARFKELRETFSFSPDDATMEKIAADEAGALAFLDKKREEMFAALKAKRESRLKAGAPFDEESLTPDTGDAGGFVNPFQDALDDAGKNVSQSMSDAANAAAQAAFDNINDANDELVRLQQERKGLSLTSPVVSSSLASIGLGGGVFGGNGNPMIAKLDKQLTYAEQQLAKLTSIDQKSGPELMR